MCVCVCGGPEVGRNQRGDANAGPGTLIKGGPIHDCTSLGATPGPFPFAGPWEKRTEGGAAAVCGDRHHRCGEETQALTEAGV